MTLAVAAGEERGALRDLLARFRERVFSSGFAATYRLHSYELASDFLEASLRKTLEHTPPVARSFVRLFYLMESVSLDAAREALGAELLADLRSHDLLVERDGGIAARHRLELFEGQVLFTDHRPGLPESAYFGEDSQFLRAMLAPRPGDRCLDLCAGTGVQGLRCAREASHVDLVDVNPVALALQQLNVVMNGLEDRVSIWEGSLYDALPADATFDYVVCNPPLMPVPDEVRFPIFGHGGPDGLTIVRTILAGLPQRLRAGGRLSLIGACTGERDAPDVERLARETLVDDFGVRAYRLMETPLLDWIRVIGQTVALYYPEISFQRAVIDLRQGYAGRFDTTYVYTYLLEADRGRSPGLEVVDYSRVGHKSFWFVNRGAFQR